MSQFKLQPLTRKHMAVFTVDDRDATIGTLQTTAEHPFWIKNTGWLKASLPEQGMILLDRNNQEVEVLSQFLLPNNLDTVYNIEVDGFHTYHVGRLGVWVHNDGCCTPSGWINRDIYRINYLLIYKRSLVMRLQKVLLLQQSNKA